jgi:hypothetical protein
MDLGIEKRGKKREWEEYNTARHDTTRYDTDSTAEYNTTNKQKQQNTTTKKGGNEAG